MTQPDPSPSSSDPPGPRGRGAAPWLMGCAAVFVFMIVVGGAAAWWFVGRPIQQVVRAAQNVSQLQSLDAGVTDRSAYQPPADGALTEAQLTRYLSVLRRVHGDLEGAASRLEQRYAEIDGRRPQWTDVPRLASAYADFLGLLVEAKESQVTALNAEGFSLAEYAWVRGQVLHAAGLPGFGYDLGAFVDAVTTDGTLVARTTPAPATEANRLLVERRRSELDDLAFLALLGL